MIGMMPNLWSRFIKSAKKNQILQDLLRERGRLKSEGSVGADSSLDCSNRITPYPPPSPPLLDDFWDFAGIPPPPRRVTNVSLPPPPPQRKADGVHVAEVTGQESVMVAEQPVPQTLPESQLEALLARTDEALLRALSKCDDDGVRVSMSCCASLV
jgi:hypothetical protein